MMLAIDWSAMFVPTHSVWEVVIRGTMIYLGLFFALRIFRREPGTLGITDLLVIVLLADAVQNGMAGEYHSVTEGAALAGTILGWSHFLNWLGYRFPATRSILQPSPLLLVRDGVMQQRAMAREKITKEDLIEQIRQHGVADIHAVHRCYLESDGHVSVILRRTPGAVLPHAAPASR